MSKSIVIQEKGIDQDLTVSKINTPELDGGMCSWVPEDETQLEELTVTENGDYTPDGYGFSKVTVNVDTPDTPVLDEINITTNGTYNAGDYGVDGFSKVNINVHGSADYTSIYFYSVPMAFYEGEAIDLTGVEIHAVKSDGTEIDITSQCTFDPPEGWVIPVGLKEFPLMVTWEAS